VLEQLYSYVTLPRTGTHPPHNCWTWHFFLIVLCALSFSYFWETGLVSLSRTCLWLPITILFCPSSFCLSPSPRKSIPHLPTLAHTNVNAPFRLIFCGFIERFFLYIKPASSPPSLIPPIVSLPSSPFSSPRSTWAPPGVIYVHHPCRPFYSCMDYNE